MAQIVGPPANVIRNRPITTELRELLNGAADATGVERVVIVSGGQTSNHAPNLKGVVGGWTGSRRHDNGGAADIELVRGGNTLSFTDTNGSQVAEFVTAAAARGATGIGAGVNYMGPKRIHVGFGNSPTDLQKLVWGAAGASANAPAWLRTAATEGWNDPVADNLAAALSVPTSGLSIVTARGGLWLRKGPGLGFDRARLLNEGTRLTVLGLDGEWARVDLEGDGRIDGHVFAAFLGAADLGDADDGVEEPVGEEALAELAGAAGPAGVRARRGARPPRAPRRRSKD
jgi:hypothetical protein